MTVISTQTPLPSREDLCRRARESPDTHERTRALSELAAIPADAELVSFVRERAAHESDHTAVLAALRTWAGWQKDDPETFPLLRLWALASDERQVRPSTARRGKDIPNDWAGLRGQVLALIYDTFRYDTEAMSFLAERCSEERELEVRKPLLEKLAIDSGKSRTLQGFLCDLGSYDPDPLCRAWIYGCLARHASKKLEVRDYLRRRAEEDIEVPAQHTCAETIIECAAHEAETWRIVRRMVTGAPELETKRRILAMLASHNAQAPETRELIFQVPLERTQGELREQAISAIVTYYPKDPRARVLLESLANNADEPWLKATASAALGRILR
jgi:hypothetical protein